jgi:hypothetical protein
MVGGDIVQFARVGIQVIKLHGPGYHDTAGEFRRAGHTQVGKQGE